MKISNAAVTVIDLISFPDWGKGAYYVWLRNFHYFKHTIFISIFWVMFEPILYFLAIGYGLGHYVGTIEGISYAEFFAPALMCVSGLIISFSETTYGSYIKLSKQKTFQSIVLSPVTASEVALGEIMWGATKGMFSAAAVGIVAVALGIISTWYVIPSIAIIGVLCWAAASFGLLMTSYAKTYDWFIYAHSGVIIPMTLVSGTYFPLTQLPEAIQNAAYILPLTHIVSAVRTLLGGEVKSTIFLNISVVFVLAVLLTNWSVSRISKKIIN